MERKYFIKTVLATATLSAISPFALVELLKEKEDIILPFADGMRKITLLKPKKGLIANLEAQVGYQTQYGYQQSYNYNLLAPYQEWYAYQQALANWNQQIAN